MNGLGFPCFLDPLLILLLTSFTWITHTEQSDLSLWLSEEPLPNVVTLWRLCVCMCIISNRMDDDHDSNSWATIEYTYAIDHVTGQKSFWMDFSGDLKLYIHGLSSWLVLRRILHSLPFIVYVKKLITWKIFSKYFGGNRTSLFLLLFFLTHWLLNFIRFFFVHSHDRKNRKKYHTHSGVTFRNWKRHTIKWSCQQYPSGK